MWIIKWNRKFRSSHLRLVFIIVFNYAGYLVLIYLNNCKHEGICRYIHMYIINIVYSIEFFGLATSRELKS